MGQEQYTYTYYPLDPRNPITDFHERVMRSKTKQERIEAAYALLTERVGAFSDHPEVRDKFLYG